MTRTSYTVFPFGNDPRFSAEGYKRLSKRCAIVTTSGAWVLKIACDILSENTDTQVSIFLIDNSASVIEYWKRLKTIFEKYETYDPEISFFFRESFPRKLYDHLLNLLEDKKICKKNWGNLTVQFFHHLIQKHGYSKVRDLILQTTLILGDWTSPEVFKPVTKNCEASEIEDVIVYATNIVGCLQYYKKYEEANAVLNNIITLNPVVAIHTDYRRGYRRCSGSTFVVRDHTQASTLPLFKAKPREPEFETQGEQIELKEINPTQLPEAAY